MSAEKSTLQQPSNVQNIHNDSPGKPITLSNINEPHRTKSDVSEESAGGLNINQILREFSKDKDSDSLQPGQQERLSMTGANKKEHSSSQNENEKSDLSNSNWLQSDERRQSNERRVSMPRSTLYQSTPSQSNTGNQHQAFGKLKSMAREVFERAHGLNGRVREDHSVLAQEIIKLCGCSQRSFDELIHGHSYEADLADLRALVPNYPPKEKKPKSKPQSMNASARNSVSNSAAPSAKDSINASPALSIVASPAISARNADYRFNENFPQKRFNLATPQFNRHTPQLASTAPSSPRSRRISVNFGAASQHALTAAQSVANYGVQQRNQTLEEFRKLDPTILSPSLQGNRPVQVHRRPPMSERLMPQMPSSRASLATVGSQTPLISSQQINYQNLGFRPSLPSFDPQISHERLQTPAQSPMTQPSFSPQSYVETPREFVEIMQQNRLATQHQVTSQQERKQLVQSSSPQISPEEPLAAKLRQRKIKNNNSEKNLMALLKEREKPIITESSAEHVPIEVKSDLGMLGELYSMADLAISAADSCLDHYGFVICAGTIVFVIAFLRMPLQFLFRVRLGADSNADLASNFVFIGIAVMCGSLLISGAHLLQQQIRDLNIHIVQLSASLQKYVEIWEIWTGGEDPHYLNAIQYIQRFVDGVIKGVLRDAPSVTLAKKEQSFNQALFVLDSLHEAHTILYSSQNADHEVFLLTHKLMKTMSSIKFHFSILRYQPGQVTQQIMNTFSIVTFFTAALSYICIPSSIFNIGPIMAQSVISFILILISLITFDLSRPLTGSFKISLDCINQFQQYLNIVEETQKNELALINNSEDENSNFDIKTESPTQQQ